MSSISEKAYEELYATRKRASGVKAFTHTSDIKRGRKAASVHDRVDPSKIREGAVGKRESRDLDGVESNAIVCMFDVTGSMRNAPVVLQEKLAKLIPTIQTKGVIDNPQVCFGAIGDCTCDRVPVQIGQFESDLAMDEDLDKFFLEGGGGGGNHESYQMALFFLARLTETDCYEKRGKRGYAFIIADEASHPKVSKEEVKATFGDVGLQEDIPIAQIAKEASEKWEVFIILPTRASSYGTLNKPYWNELFPQHVLELDNVDLVCELIASTIGEAEGSAEVEDIAGELGMDKSSISSVKNALAEYKGGGGALATVTGDLDLSDDEDGID
jgi:hypothetical protein